MKKLFFISISSLSQLFAMGDGGVHADPLRRMDYRKAFEQEAIYKKHNSILAEMGLLDNALPSEGETRASEEAAGGAGDVVRRSASSVYVALPAEAPVRSVELTARSNTLHVAAPISDHVLERKQFKDFQAACLAQLKTSRRDALLEPAREAGTLIALMGVATIAIMQASGPDSFGGSFSIFAAMFNCVWFLRDIIRSGYNLYHTPPHPLDRFEIDFALNRCFIPRTVWPVMNEKFMTARTNPFAERASLDFIRFSLGLTTLGPKPTLALSAPIDTIKTRIRATINHFFTSYEPFNHEMSLSKIRANVIKFVSALDAYHQGNSFESSRPIFLNGPGGIGKTHLARNLQTLIRELFGDVVQFHDVVLGSVEELEGTDTQPGLFLRILQSMCVGKALGSIVFMDEATWLNSELYKSAAKRVFNGSLSTLKTKFFGNGADGLGLELPLPPMLVLVAANEDIADAALKSRFDCIAFPTPKKQSLLNYAYSLVNNKLRSFGIAPTMTDDGRIDGIFDDRKQRLHTIIAELTSFRAIEEAVPPLLEDWEA